MRKPKKPTTYEPILADWGEPDMQEATHGRGSYVSYYDYLQLQKKYEALQKKYKKLQLKIKETEKSEVEIVKIKLIKSEGLEEVKTLESTKSEEGAIEALNSLGYTLEYTTKEN
jgi:L-lactate utilization protein LutC